MLAVTLPPLPLLSMITLLPPMPQSLPLLLVPQGSVHAFLTMHSAPCSLQPPNAQAPQNVINVSIPTVFDPSLAPPGKHLIHAYTGKPFTYSKAKQFHPLF